MTFYDVGYWAECDTLRDMNMRGLGVKYIRLPSEGLSSEPVEIDYMFGVPFIGSYEERALDIKRINGAVFSLDGDRAKSDVFKEISGMIGSLFEGLIFDQLFKNKNGNGISTVSVFNMANREGIPIYYIDKDNIGDALPKLNISAAVIEDIRNAVNAGKTVITPMSNISYYGWTGIGYIVRDPVTGSSGYFISGGAAGEVFKRLAEEKSAIAFDETPFSPGIINAVDKWTASVKTPVVEKELVDWDLELKKLVEAYKSNPGEPGPSGQNIRAFNALNILMLAVIIATVIDLILDTKVDENYEQFRHYTDMAGREAIVLSGEIWMTENGDLGTGAYVTDIYTEPDTYENRRYICDVINKQPTKTCPDFINAYVGLFIDRKRFFLRQGLPGEFGIPYIEHQFVRPFEKIFDRPKEGVIFVRPQL